MTTETKKTDHRCQGSVWYSFHYGPCGAKAKYEEGGAWYCGSHAPSKIAEKERKRKLADADKKREWDYNADVASARSNFKTARDEALSSAMIAAELALDGLFSFGTPNGKRRMTAAEVERAFGHRAVPVFEKVIKAIEGLAKATADRDEKLAQALAKYEAADPYKDEPEAPAS